MTNVSLNDEFRKIIREEAIKELTLDGEDLPVLIVKIGRKYGFHLSYDDVYEILWPEGDQTDEDL